MEVNLHQLTRQLGVPNGAVRRGKGLGYTLLIDCKECGEAVEFVTHKGYPPEQMAKKIRASGWITKPLLCPKHAAAHALKHRNEPKGKADMPQTEPKPADPTAAAKAAQRNVLRWLDEAFNTETGTYAAGISDATIAAETGVSKDKVAKLREDFHGPLKAPTEWQSLWDGMDQIYARIDDIEKDAAAAIQQLRADLGATKAQTLTRHAPPGSREAAICSFARSQLTQIAAYFSDRDEQEGRPSAVDYVGTLMDSGFIYMDRVRG